MHRIPQPVPGSRIVDRVPVDGAVQPWPERPVRSIAASWRGPLHVRIEGVEFHLRYVAFHHHVGTGAYPLHTHPYAEILLTLSGAGGIRMPGGDLDCGSGSVVVVPPRVVHGTRWAGRATPWRVLVIDFDLDIDVGRLPLESGDPVDPAFSPFYERFFMQEQPRMALTPAELRRVRALAGEIEHVLAGSKYGVASGILACVLRLFTVISRSLREQGLATGRHVVAPRFSRDAALLKARSQLESRVLFDPGVIGRLARSTGLSEEHFIRAFRAMFGISPKRYAQTLLMRRACGLLEGTALPVRDVAERLGYEDASTFSRAFRRFVGTSPEPYRAERRPPAAAR